MDSLNIHRLIERLNREDNNSVYMPDDQFDNLPDGIGCAEIMEYMSDYRNSSGIEEPGLASGDDPILSEIGDTPIVQHPDNEQILCKMERQNPTLSHKDRIGVGMIRGLREMGKLEPGQRVVEASSGNTAGAVALAANRMGHPCTIVMRENASPVKMGFVKALDAELITTPSVGPEHEFYYQKVAETYAIEHDAVYLNQYERELNRLTHYEWTSPELYKQIDSEDVTHIVGAMSTGGIMSGIGEYFKEVEPGIQIIGVDAFDSNLWRAFHNEEYEPDDYDSDIEGLGQWRVTNTTNFEVIDDIRKVSDSIARSRAKHEASDNGLLIGLSSGAAMEIAQEISQENDNAQIVSIVHDGAEQYFYDVGEW